jgi:hypothetical protein
VTYFFVGLGQDFGIFAFGLCSLCLDLSLVIATFSDVSHHQGVLDGL